MGEAEEGGGIETVVSPELSIIKTVTRVQAGFMLIFLASATVRLCWVAAEVVTKPELYSAAYPIRAWEMGRIATNIAEGRGFSSPFDDHGSSPTAWECPIVPFLLAGFIKIAGGPSGRARLLIVLAQSLVSAFTAAVYWLIGRRLATKHHDLFAAWMLPVFAAVVCLWPEAIRAVTFPWYFVWQEAGLAVTVLAAMQWWDRGDLRSAITVGIAGGVLTLTNVTPLPIVAFGIFYPALNRRRILPAAAAAASVAILVTPWLIRNAVVFQTLVPLRSNTGYELFQGNNEIECIREPVNSPHPASDPREYQKYISLGEVQYNRDALHRAAQYVRQHPLQTAQRIAARIYVSWLTDLADHWNANRGGWSTGRLIIFTSGLLTLCGLVVIVRAVLLGHFLLLPYAPLFGAVLILLPLTNYFTLADAEYTSALRMWVAVVAIFLASTILPVQPTEEPGDATAEVKFNAERLR